MKNKSPKTNTIAKILIDRTLFKQVEKTFEVK